MLQDPFIFFGLAVVGGIGAAGLLAICIRRFEVAVFIMTLSPMLSAMFVNHNAGFGAYQATTFGSYLRVGTLMLMGCAGAIIFIRERLSNSTPLPLPLKLFMVFMSMALVSYTYSLEPPTTLIRAVSMVAFFSFIFAVFYHLKDLDDFRSVMQSIYMMVVVVVILNLIALLVFRGHAWYRGGSRFCGLWGHPNMMGMFAMVNYPILLWKYHRSDPNKKWQVMIIGALLVVMHVLTGSRSSLMLGLITYGTWSLVMRQHVRLMIAVIFFATAGLAAIQVTEVPESFQRKKFGKRAELTSFNGRAEFWAGALLLVSEKPLTGYGYGVGGKIWDDPRFKSDEHLWSGSSKASLHNGYIGKMVSVGVIGFLVWLAALFYPIIKSKSIIFTDYRAYFIATMVPMLILNFVESAIGSNGSNPGSPPFWMAWIIGLKMILYFQFRNQSMPSAQQYEPEDSLVKVP